MATRKRNDSDEKEKSRGHADRGQGRKAQFLVFNSVSSVRIAMQSLHNRFMNGELDKDQIAQARANMALIAELVSREFLERDVDTLKELVAQARSGLRDLGGCR